MSNDGQAKDIIRQIFDSITTASGTESVSDCGTESPSSSQILNSLDRLLSEWSQTDDVYFLSNNDALDRLDDHLKQLDAQPEVEEEEDTFPSHPMDSQVAEKFKNNMDAIRRFSDNMHVLRQLRSKGYDIADGHTLQEMFNQIGNGDVVIRAEAADTYLNKIAETISSSLEQYQTVLPFIDRYLNANGNTAVLQGIVNDIGKEKLRAQIRYSYVGENVISLHDYPHQHLVKNA